MDFKREENVNAISMLAPYWSRYALAVLLVVGRGQYLHQ